MIHGRGQSCQNCILRVQKNAFRKTFLSGRTINFYQSWNLEQKLPESSSKNSEIFLHWNSCFEWNIISEVFLFERKNIPINSFCILTHELLKRRINFSTVFVKQCSTCPEDFNQDKRVYFQKEVIFNRYLFSELYQKTTEIWCKCFARIAKSVFDVSEEIFFGEAYFLNINLNFHQCWILKRNWFWILSNIRQRRHNWTLGVARTFCLNKVFLVIFLLYIVSGVDEKNSLDVWSKYYGRVAEAAFYVSRWTCSDKTFFFWVNRFCLSIFDFQG